MYRSGYSPKHTEGFDLVTERWPLKDRAEPDWQFWLGAGLHFSAMVSDDMIVWGLTHKDEVGNEASETWEHSDVKTEDVTGLMERYAPGWHPAVKALVATTPKER